MLVVIGVARSCKFPLQSLKENNWEALGLTISCGKGKGNRAEFFEAGEGGPAGHLKLVPVSCHFVGADDCRICPGGFVLLSLLLVIGH